MAKGKGKKPAKKAVKRPAKAAAAKTQIRRGGKRGS